MTAQKSRLILMITAFAAGLVLCLGLVLVVTQRGSVPMPQASAVGGPFRLIDQNGRIVIELDVATVRSTVLLGRPHDDRANNVALLDSRVWLGRLHRSDDDVTNAAPPAG